MFKRRFTRCLDVVQIQEIIEQGVTLPVRCMLNENIKAIVKYQRNRCGTNVLINEWVGNGIADLIGLTIPRYGLCNISETVIRETNENEEIDIANCGTAFFSETLTNSAPITRKALSEADNKETERLLLFDHLIKNEDRHKGNFLQKVAAHKIVYFIDCSHFLTKNGDLNTPIDIEKETSEENILDPRLLSAPGENWYDIFCLNMGYREDILMKEAEKIKHVLSPGTLDMIKQSVPKEWITEESGERVENMFLILRKRLEMIDKIAEMILKERRKQPWKSY